MDDVEQLRRIKLLRMLGISCENIRQLQSGELDFDQCMADRLTELEKTGASIEHMKMLCRILREESDSISEEGIRMQDTAACSVSGSERNIRHHITDEAKYPVELAKGSAEKYTELKNNARDIND